MTFSNLIEMIDDTFKMGIQIFVCKASKQMLGSEKIDPIAGVEIVDAATLNDLSLNADTEMWF